MAKLEYKLKSKNKSPVGKARVWFCANPDDYGLYFDSITDMLLSSCDCAVWYDAEPRAEYSREELSVELERMQLFVIPVTRKFLTEPSRAFDLELRLALEMHIPILPILVEKGITALFNERVGSIQYLDRLSSDSTAISFEEKLDKFLGAVLLDDTVSARVRAAFAGYIFLSYRKIDRARANDIMRLIHSDERYRDVAIWYDEYLTPGENFNDEIKSALEKCGLFMLLVTPNLPMPNDEGEDNYVVREEYPLARKMGKRVLAAEVESTERATLESKFKDIPECIDPTEDGRLHDALEGIFHNNAECDSAEKDFLLGLAYLYGIDVEVDRQRGFELISKAAEAGNYFALSKLADMYRYGDGVAADGQKAIDFQYRVTICLVDLYNESEDGEILRMLIDSLIVLQSDYSLVRDDVGLQHTAERILDACAGKEGEYMCRSRAIAYAILSNSYLNEGDVEKSLECIDKGIKECEGFKADFVLQLLNSNKLSVSILIGGIEGGTDFANEYMEIDTVDGWDKPNDMVAATNHNLALVIRALSNGEYGEAVEVCLRDLEALERLYSFVDEGYMLPVSTLVLLINIASQYCMQLVTASHEVGEGADEAYRYNVLWLERSRELYSKHGLEGVNLNVARYCQNLAMRSIKLGATEPAIAYLDEAIEILEREYEPQLPLDKLIMFVSVYLLRADLYMKGGELSEAARDCISAAYYGDMLPPSTISLMTTLAQLCDGLSKKLFAEKQIEVALKVGDWAYIFNDRLAKETGDTDCRNTAVACLIRCADCRYELSDYEAAEDCYARAARLSQELDGGKAGGLRTVLCNRKRFMCAARSTELEIAEYIDGGDSLAAEDELEAAKDLYLRAEEAIHKLSTKLPTQSLDKKVICTVYERLMNISKRLGEEKEASAYAAKYNEARIRYLREEGRSCYREGKMRVDNRRQGGIEYLERSVAAYAELCEELDDEISLFEYVEVCYTLGTVNGYEHRRKLLQKTKALIEKMIEQNYAGKTELKMLERVKAELEALDT